MNTVELQDIAEVVQGGRSRLTGQDFVPHGYPAYGAGGLNGYVNRYEFDEDAIVLSSIGARCGKCFLATGRWTSLANTQVIRPARDLVDARFLWFLLNDEARWPRSGTGQPFIKPSDVKRHRVLLPSLSEQKRLALLLEETDRLRGMRRYGFQICDELPLSTFLEMFDDPAANPKCWPECELGEIVSAEKFAIVDGPFGSALKAQEYTDAGVRVIRVNNIQPNWFNFADVRFVSKAKYETIARSTVRPGDVVMAKVGNTIGKTCIFPNSIPFAVMTANVCKITLDRSVAIPEFIARQMNMDQIEARIIALSGDTAKPMINIPKLRQLKLIVPPIPLQQQFAKLVECHEHLRASELEALRQADHLFQTLLHQALATDPAAR